MGVKLAIAASLLIALGGAGLLWSWWRQAERELDNAQAIIETLRAADAAGQEAVRGYVTMEKGAKDAREKGEKALDALRGADDGAFWDGLGGLLAPDAGSGRHAAGDAAGAVR